jgi:ATP-dependent Clp protease ATP-binding subunit ClpX
MMLDVMYEIPSREDIDKCIITKETVINKGQPKFVLKDGTVVEEKRRTSA